MAEKLDGAHEQLLKEIGAYALEIYKRMAPGGSVMLQIPTSTIVTPTDPTPRDGGFLFIAKPTGLVGLNAARMPAPEPNPEKSKQG